MPWIKPVLRNHCGYYSIHLGEPKRKPDGWFDPDPGVPVVLAGKYRIRWPDGKEEEIDIFMVPYLEPSGGWGEVPQILIPDPKKPSVKRIQRIDLSGFEIWVEEQKKE